MEIKKYLAELLGTFFLAATLVGGVIGVGLAKGAEHLDYASIKRIIASWLVTIPAGAAFTILFYILLRIIFSV